MPLQNLKIFGKGEQAKYNGTNLIDYAKAKSNVGNVEIKQNGNRLSVKNNNAYAAIVDIPMILDAGTYYLSASSSSVPIYRNDTWFANGILENSKKGTFKVTEAGEYVARITIQAQSTSSVDSLMCSALENVEYEPYTGGKPSPSPDYPQEITIAGESGTIDLEIAGENVEPQTIIFTTPNGLMGIKVKSDGNYTDSTGQQWITDRVIEKDGVIGIERNIDKAIVDGTVLNFSTNGSADFWNMPQRSMPGIKEINMSTMCQYLPQGIFCANQSYEFAWLSGANGRKYFGTIEKANEFLVQKNNEGNPLHIYYVKNPTFEPLPQSEQDAIRTLHSNYPTTVVTNDADAPMKLTYTADTKHYIDKKFEELNQAIVNTQIALL